MKWVKTAIGAVIAILSVGIIANSVYNMTKETVKVEGVFTYEVLTYNDGVGTIDDSFYDIVDFFVTDDENIVTNLVNLTVNGKQSLDVVIEYEGFDIWIFGTIDGDDIGVFLNDDYITSDGYIGEIGDVWVITLGTTQPPQLTGITATLLTLSILVFASAILFSFYNIRKEGDF